MLRVISQIHLQRKIRNLWSPVLLWSAASWNGMGSSTQATPLRNVRSRPEAQIPVIHTKCKPPPTGDFTAKGEDNLRVAGLSYVRLAAPVFLLDHLHLVFQAKLELFNAHFFQLFIFREISFFDQGAETLGVLTVFLGQPTKFFVAGKKLFANGVYHPDEPPA